MKKIILLIIVCLLFTAGGVAWALADTSQIPAPKATVEEAVSAEIKKNNSGEWTQLVIGAELESGDVIKTGADGLAVLNFFDNSISRLGPNSETSLSEVYLDQKNPNKTKVSLKMETGRIWTQVVQLLDIESSFEIESSNTVATVRGTVFDFEVTPEGTAKVNSDESYVEVEIFEPGVERKIINRFNVLEGFGAEVKNNAPLEELKEIKTQALSEEYKNSEWVKKNILRDSEDLEKLEKKRRLANDNFVGIMPGSPLYGLKKIGEQLRLATAEKGEKAELKNIFIEKRLIESFELARQGKEGLAEKQLNFLEKQLENLPEGEGEIKYKIRHQLLNESEIIDSEFLDKMESLEEKTANNVQEEEFIRAKQLERRIKKAREFKLKGEADKFNEDLKKIDLELQNKNQFNQEYIPRLEIKRELLNEIKPPLSPLPIVPAEDSLEIKDNIISPNSVVDPPSSPLIENQTTPQATTAPALIVLEPAIVNPPLKKIQAFKINAPKYNILANAQLQFRAVLVFDDGTVKDVTDSAEWSLAGDIGAIGPGGLLRSDDDGGKGIVSAVFNEGSVPWSARSPEVTALVLDL
jgi:hypothetical protein